MLFDPTERNVDPFLFPTRIRTMKKLVLTSAIHDKYVTMAETAQVSFIIRTGPTPPSEDCVAAKMTSFWLRVSDLLLRIPGPGGQARRWLGLESTTV